MDRMQIIEHLYRSREVDEALSKMQPEDLRDDLKQECFMVLLELPEERFNQIHSDGALKFFFIRTMLNMIRSNTSGFYRKYRNFNELAIDIEECNTQDVIDAFPMLNNMHWYERDIFTIYMGFDCNVRKVSDFTKIPYMSCYKTIDHVKRVLKKKIRKSC